MKGWFTRMKLRFFGVAMIVEGNDVIGYLARYPDDQDAVWASSRQAAVDGCNLRSLYDSFGRDRRR